MKLFKKETNKQSCCGSCTPNDILSGEALKKDMGIKILGSGCAKCNALEAAVQTALQELDMKLEIAHIKDFSQIASYGVMTTPALVYQGKVVAYGKVLTVTQVKEILHQQTQMQDSHGR